MTPRTPKRAAGLPPGARRSALPGSAAAPVVAEPGAGAPVPPGVPAQTAPQRHGRVAAAGKPVPGTGADLSSRGSVPGRVRVLSPAGGELDADGSLSAGSTGRTFTITLPAGLKLLSLNDRGHWATRYRRSQALKEAARARTLQAKVPPLERVAVIVEYRPPDRRHRDADNIVASAKACIDGIVAAGVLPDDECPRYVSKIVCTIGELYPKGMLVLYLIEVAAATGSDAA